MHQLSDSVVCVHLQGSYFHASLQEARDVETNVADIL